MSCVSSSDTTECHSRVKCILRECHRTNEKFVNTDFDAEDLSEKNCLQGLKYWYDEKPAATVASAISPRSLGSALKTLIQADVLMQNAAPVDFIADAKLLTRASADDGDEPRPGSFHRIDWVVDKPEFGIDGSKLQMLSKGEVETAGLSPLWLPSAAIQI
ncbi:hypothetical protein HBH98_166190 [Parastagonospora nodorum]|nr:hypothetical protein HBH54_097900 [Parastagonospora nodorum]KAH3944367.1 hypothetical protein HBH53_159380 [Parastagonospora nodorum]KAH4014200.1 hypothetical protein HBI13_170910 [Parastagonospora nodorum]KAH4070773.1 hypothetical protein HBH50_088790 [Parastagonospora nodorum]KAH4159671.1 hypothetical protein HBH44_107720 [Parastagonospora nodorum]